MSESKFVMECGRAFRAKHRAKDGWIMFRVAPYSAGVYTPLLPAFLLSEAPATVVKKDLYFDVAWNARGKRTVLSQLPTRRRSKGIHEDDWYGEIEINWQGCPIHYYRTPYRGINSEGQTTWIATKNHAKFEKFWGALVSFRQRRFRSRSEISVVNGTWMEKPKLEWDDMVLPGKMAQEIRSNAESFLKARAHYRAMNLPYRRGFLFAGPPGVGKTFAAKVIYSKLRANAYTLELKAEMEDRDLKAAFEAASVGAPSVLLLEDLDRLIESPKISMSFLLNLLDGLEAQEGILVIATTNAPEKLDQALLHRPSRFDRVWHFPLPSLQERQLLLEKRGNKYFSSAGLRNAAERTSGFTMAYTQEAVVSAMLTAVNENRAPTDADLMASVDELLKQLRNNQQKDGAIKVDGPVGFASVNGK